MSATAPHALPWEHSPPSATASLLVLATALAATGAWTLPRPSAAPSPPRVDTAPPARVTPPPPPPPPTPVAAVAPARPPAAPPDPRCPPRWSVRFEHGSFAAPAGLPARFARLRTFLAENPRASVLVLGFADPEGSDRDNQVLSLRRATGVSRALRRAGVDGARMTVRGIGALTAMEEGEAGYAEMRRVAVRVRGLAPCVGAPEEVVGP